MSARTDAEVALDAALAGAAVIRERYGTPQERFAKSDTDFATATDIDAEAAILAVIRGARPDDALRGEESGLTGSDGAARTWLVDPLCGTLNFAATTPLIAVNVALRTGPSIAVAAVVDPIAGEAFWTDGDGAWLRRGAEDVRLEPSPVTALVDVNLDAVHPDPGRFRPAELLGHPDFRARYGGRVLSTTLAVTWVAAGRRAAYVTESQDVGFADNVHFAAGVELCRAAGCVVTDLRGEPLGTPGGSGLLVAADLETHEVLLDLVAASQGSSSMESPNSCQRYAGASGAERSA